MRRRRRSEPLAVDDRRPPTGWCLACGAEYRPGFTFCAGCRVELVEDRAPVTTGPAGRGSRRSAYRSHCPRCGTRFPTAFRGEWFETSPSCAECGVAVAGDTPLLAPSAGEVAYALPDLALIERAAITADLMEEAVPFRWEDGLVLVVPGAAEARVDMLVDDIAGGDGESKAPGVGP